GMVGIEGGVPHGLVQLAYGDALHFVVHKHGEELNEGGLLLDGLAIADVGRLQETGEPEGAEHRGELMGQFHASDLLSSDSGSGKKVVHGRACRDGVIAGAVATGGSPGSGCRSSAWTRTVLTAWERDAPTARARAQAAS